MASASAKIGAETEERDIEMEGWWERKDHPLLNDVVLKIIFESMSGEDLKECRLVCKKWCVLSLPSVRSKFSIKLNGNGTENTGSMKDFVEVFKENKLGIPFVEYYLSPFCTREGPGQEFLQICGSTAKMVSLTLPDPPIVKIVQIRGRFVKVVSQREQEPNVFTVQAEDISAILKAMPNIQAFSISHRIHSQSGNVVKLFPDDSSTEPTLNFLKTLFVYDDHETSEYCPTFMEEILSVAPNISDITVQDTIYDPHRSRIGQVLNAIEKFERQSVVRNLNLINAKFEHVESLRRLAENGLKLKELDFLPGDDGYDEDEDMIELLPPLATIFKNSIERLHVDKVCSSFIQLPYMPTLEKLEFRISEDFDSKSVNLNKLFPALNELKLCLLESGNDVIVGWEFLPNSDPCPKVKTLCLEQVTLRIQPFDHILNIFPNLTKLVVQVKTDGVQIVRKIMTEMTQLEDLSVSGTLEGIENIDAFLTAIPIQNIQELVHVVSELKEMPVQLRAESIRHYRTQHCQFPSITNLTNLKHLHLDTVGRYGDGEDDQLRYTQMTDVFAYFGLYSMKHINKLEIGQCEFTKATCEILTAEMELETWSFMVRWPDFIP